MRNNKGITLIALAITIAVLMILAAITIGELTSDNGLLSETRRGLSQQEDLTQNEEQYMNELQEAGSEDYLGNGANQPAEFDPPVIRLKEEVIPGTPLSVGGSVKEIKEGKVPIPTGFYYVGGSLNTGLVISDAAADENRGDGHSVNLIGNQFVWIPVEEVKSRIAVQVTNNISGEEVRKWATGTRDIAYFSTNGTVFTEEDIINVTANGIYTVYVKSNNGQAAVATVNVSKMVGGVNDMYEVQNGDKVGKLYNFGYAPKSPAVQMPYSTTGTREPDILTNYDTDANVSAMGINGVTTQAQFKTHLQTEFNKMIESVGKYKGFYIGRYETGDLSQATVVSKKNNIDIGGQTWYTMYKKQKDMYASSSLVVSNMIWGSQWDRVLRWFQSFGGETETYVTDSTGKGNYGTDTPIATGSNSAYAVKNIYDMAGNVDEWTIEICITVRGLRRKRLLQHRLLQ